MAKMKRLIFKVNNLEKKYGSICALDLKKLDIHPGTIYGVVGNVISIGSQEPKDNNIIKTLK